jgi:hypothetical protein
MDQK